MGYPNEEERRRLERFPDRIAVEDLRACFALSDRDRSLVFGQRGPENRLGLAVSLCAPEFLGFVPDDVASVPGEAMAFVAGQVDAAPHELLAYAQLYGATRADDQLLAALRRVRASRERFVDEQTDIVPKAWRAWVCDEDGRVQRTRFELALSFVVRDAMRARRLFRPIGRRYADSAGVLLPAERWQADRHELAVTFGRTLDADQRLAELQAEQQQALRSLQAAVDAGDGATCRRSP